MNPFPQHGTPPMGMGRPYGQPIMNPGHPGPNFQYNSQPPFFGPHGHPGPPPPGYGPGVPPIGQIRPPTTITEQPIPPNQPPVDHINKEDIPERLVIYILLLSLSELTPNCI